MDVFSAVNNVNRKMDNYQVQNQKIQQNAQKPKTHDSSTDLEENKSKEEIKRELKKIVDELNNSIAPLNPNLEFKFNDKIDDLIMELVDKKNNEVIRQFPPKDAIQLMEKMKELVGILFDKKG